ncbi:MAG: DMT family transporter [Thermoplasmata archaeon]|nr:DMT family transporter [Thermoplasmata archaeon]
MATAAIGPIWLVELRVSVAAVTLIAYALATGRRDAFPDFGKRPAAWFLMAALSGAVPFLLISTAELRLSASLAAILNATVPLFTAVFAASWLAEPLRPGKILGVALGFFGVVVLVGGGGLALSTLELAAVGASLTAAVLYAAGGVYTKRRFGGTSSLSLAVGLLSASAILVAPLAIGTGHLPEVGPVVLASVLGLALLCTAFAYLIYFHLLQKVGPTPTLSVTFLVPVFGLAWSDVLLGEPIAISSLAGLALILLGVGLVTRSPVPAAKAR